MAGEEPAMGCGDARSAPSKKRQAFYTTKASSFLFVFLKKTASVNLNTYELYCLTGPVTSRVWKQNAT